MTVGEELIVFGAGHVLLRDCSGSLVFLCIYFLERDGIRIVLIADRDD